LELNERLEPIAVLYDYALQASGYRGDLEWIKGGNLPGVYGRRLTYRDGALYVFVSEYAHDTQIEIKAVDTGVSYSFELERERAVLFATDLQGRVTSVYRPDEVKIQSQFDGRA
jgi:hypothetical protein